MRGLYASVIGRNAPPVVILGRSKERSDAAQTPGSMPRPQSVAAAQNSAPLRPSAKATAWIRRVASLLLRPGMTKWRRLRPTSSVGDGPFMPSHPPWANRCQTTRHCLPDRGR
ncbi:MAG: hypothetical protein EOS50_04955 [Mesorhizobium sp.]|nr:MAG: hypothetical protein EOS34_14455 [Mesorhizobium sp.]RWF58089.1 MAG: hypothetical protein EOS50_04955 [Mesorhizobium sp.]